MNKKGFTLIELFAVIIILALIAILTTTGVSNIFKSAKNKLSDIQIESIISSAEIFGVDHSKKLPNEGECKYVTLKDLKNDNLLSNDVLESIKENKLNEDIKVTITGIINPKGKLVLSYKVNPESTEGCKHLLTVDPGLYDEDENMLASWDELLAYGLNVEANYDNDNYQINPGTAYYVLNNNPELKNGVEIVISESVTSIGDFAFHNCDTLKSIVLPSSVTSIGIHSFTGCINLESIVVDDNNPIYDSRNNSNAIIITESNTLLLGCKNTNIPTDIKTIFSNSFWGSGLKSIDIPEGVEKIKVGAFAYCPDLKSVKIPSSVTSIEEQLFVESYSLEEIVIEKGNTVFDDRDGLNAIIEKNSGTLISGCKTTIIPEGVKSIGDYAFYGHTGLTKIEFPTSLESIGKKAFVHCILLENITIPQGVKSIGDRVFSYCYGLKSIEIPDSVETIGEDTFSFCNNLNSIHYKGSDTGFPWGAPNATLYK